MADTERMRSCQCREKLNDKNLDLPFIAKRNDKITFWDVEPSGDYAMDCQTGRNYASLALAHMIKEDFIPIFTWAIMDMPRKKDATGIEIGFLEFFAEVAIYTDKRQRSCSARLEPPFGHDDADAIATIDLNNSLIKLK